MFLSRDDGTIFNVASATHFRVLADGSGVRVSWAHCDLYLDGEEARLVQSYLETQRYLGTKAITKPQPAEPCHVTLAEPCS